MKEIVFPDENLWLQLTQFITKDTDVETAAIGLAKLSSGQDYTRLIVKKLLLPGEGDYLRRSGARVCFSPKFMEKIYAECLENNLHVIDFHDHYFQETDAGFSWIDDNEQLNHWGPYVNRWFENLHLAFVVFGKDPLNLDARLWVRQKNKVEPLDKIKILSPDRMRFILPNSSKLHGTFDKDTCDRTILAVGEELQKKLSCLTLAGVGCGGLGSPWTELAARLPVKKLILVDDDVVTASNLNRLLGATPKDAVSGIKKVELARREISKINPNIEIMALDADFLTKETQEVCKQADMILGFTDNVGARFAINKLALAHGMPYFDLGCGGKAENGKLVWARSQVIKVVPTAGFCLQCGNFFSSKKAQIDLMNKRELKAQRDLGYIEGNEVPQLSVYSWNMIASAWAAWLLVNYLSEDCPRLDGITTDMLSFRTRPWREDLDEKGRKRPPNACHICGEGGIWGCGDEVPFLLRQNDDQSVPSATEGSEDEKEGEEKRVPVGSAFLKQIELKKTELEAKSETSGFKPLKGISKFLKTFGGRVKKKTVRADHE